MTSKWVPTTNLAMLRRMGKSIEELAELASVCARCIIQGIDEIDPASGKTNRQRLTEETADVYAQCDENILALGLDYVLIDDRRERKRGYMRAWEAMFQGEAAVIPPPAPEVVSHAKEPNPIRTELIQDSAGVALRLTTPANNTLTMSKAQALALAVDLVLLCDGQLVLSSNSKDCVTAWNTDSPFHRAYQEKVMPEKRT